MRKRGVAEWINQTTIKQVLFSFSSPKTPRQVERELGIKKLKLKPFLEKRLLESLNPEKRKGRLYVLTNRTRRLLGLSIVRKNADSDWDTIGFIMAGQKQRLVVLKTVDLNKRTSEEIRAKASRLNSRLSRISTKGILKELLNTGLVKTDLIDRKRYYWISEKGLEIKNYLTEEGELIRKQIGYLAN